MPDTPDAAGRWLPVERAAVALGVTERTVRRRVVAGQLQTRRIRNRTEVLVAPDAAPDPSGDDGRAPDTPDAPTLAPVTVPIAVWREERQRASAAEQAASMWQERAANLEAEVGRLEALLALPEHAPDPPAWWRRLLRRP